MLLKIPPAHRPLTNCLSLSGVISLKEGCYSKRYIGSKAVSFGVNGTIKLASNEKDPQKKAAKRKEKIAPTSIDHIPKDNPNCTGDHSSSKRRAYSIARGIITQRIKQCIIAQKTSKELYFVTISFPKQVSDQQGYKYLNQWLTVARKERLIRQYLWVAERQKIGTIHFHIAIPHRVYVPKLNRIMVTVLSNEVRKGRLDYNLQAAKRYNGVDLAKHRTTKKVINFAVKKSGKSLANYLTKYITKNTSEFPHLAWHNSRMFSNLVIKISFTDSEIHSIQWMNFLNDSKIFATEFFTFIPWYGEPPDCVIQHFAQVNSFVMQLLSDPPPCR